MLFLNKISEHFTKLFRVINPFQCNENIFEVLLSNEVLEKFVCKQKNVLKYHYFLLFQFTIKSNYKTQCIRTIRITKANAYLFCNYTD